MPIFQSSLSPISSASSSDKHAATVDEACGRGRKNKVADFAQFLLDIGDGTVVPPDGSPAGVVEFSENLRSSGMTLPLDDFGNLSDDARDALIGEVYPDLKAHLETGDYRYLMNRAILTPLNVDVEAMNERVLHSLELPADSVHEYLSVDTALGVDEGSALYPLEFLNSLSVWHWSESRKN